MLVAWNSRSELVISFGVGRRSPHVEPVAQRLQSDDFAVTIEQVPYEFQRSGNEMLPDSASGHVYN